MPILTDRHLGKFVRSGDEYGFGKLSTISENGTATVRYFSGPVPDPYVYKSYPVADLQLVCLPTQTRVFVRQETGWKVGRADGEDAHDPQAGTCVVAFPKRADGTPDGAVVAEDKMEVRWDSPVDNPHLFLAELAGESPRLYRQRLDLITSCHQQRAASTGVEGLFLSSVNLHDHQLSVVRRVAQDVTRRYLLADEVGLGKTIESCALIRQRIDLHPEAKILVLVPDQLCSQWKAELENKFITWGHKSEIEILSHADSEDWPEKGLDVLVVDEAHRLTRSGIATDVAIERLAKLAKDTQEIFLLSATPVRSNEAGFLDLLHLLDPENYRRDQVEEFTRRVELRSPLAWTYQALTPDLEIFEVRVFGEQLTGWFPTDARLAELVADAEVADGASLAEVIIQMREHLSEAYRIHHRVLRTRRTPEIDGSHFVRGRQRARPFEREVVDESEMHRVALLDGYRGHLTGLLEEGEITRAEAKISLREVAERCGSTPQAILEIPATSNKNFQEWANSEGRESLAAIQSTCDEVSSRFLNLLKDETLAKGTQRVVVFSSFSEVAIFAARGVAALWSEERVAKHVATATRQENAAELNRWLSDDDCTLLFCDQTGEEGINLQLAEVMFHLDLPWETSRLEQRIGRCDRYVGKRTEPIPSVVIHFGYQPYARNWFAFLADGCGVFDRSVSSLQYVLADVESDLQEQVLTDGAAVLASAVDDQTDALREELREIEAHDALDSVDVDHSQINKALRKCDEDPRFQDALVDWFEGVNIGVGKPSTDPGVRKLYMKKKARPQVPEPLERAIRPWFADDKRIAISRSAAVDHRLQILRAGFPLMDDIATHLDSTDRGVAFAFLRPLPNVPPTPFFRTDQLVRIGPNEELLETARSLGQIRWLRRELQAVLPPVVETIYLTESGAEVDREEVLREYESNPAGEPPQWRPDLNLVKEPDLFKRLTEPFDWERTCNAAHDYATMKLAERPSHTSRPTEAATALRQTIGRRRDRQLARHDVSLSVDEHTGFSELVAAVPERLEIESHLLGAGVIFFADPSIFADPSV